MKPTRTKLLHPLSWYEQEYGLPEQTVVNAYKRGWPLEDPAKLVEKLIRAPGPKSKGLQALINYTNGQSGPSTVHRGSSRNARKPKVESSVRKPAGAQGDHSATIRVEVAIGPLIFWRLITSAEADKILRLTTEPWQTIDASKP